MTNIVAISTGADPSEHPADPARAEGDANGLTATIIFHLDGVWPPQDKVLLDTVYGPTGAEYTGTLTVGSGSGPSAADIAAAILAQAQVTPIHADARAIKGYPLTGTGQVGDEFGV